MAKHTLAALPYAYDALEPFIDAQTMRIHHDKHHQAYIDKLNAALERHPRLQEWPVEELLKNLGRVPSEIRDAVRNHGGGHFNHSFFWPTLRRGVPMEGEIREALQKTFGGGDEFALRFKQAAIGHFGSGWAWLVMNGNHELEILSTPNQDSPLSQGLTPVLGLDLWEHAYYLKYQNRRPEYVDAFFNVIDWQKVDGLYRAARQEALAAKR
ncbi:MAG: superoxide dismutase [Candidatus Eisenbacteria bacterium]